MTSEKGTAFEQGARRIIAVDYIEGGMCIVVICPLGDARESKKGAAGSMVC